MKRLHTLVDDKTALGWGVQELVEGATASVHTGSAGMFYAVVALWPSRDLAVADVRLHLAHGPGILGQLPVACEKGDALAEGLGQQ